MGVWAEQVFERLTLEERVGQLICYRASKWADETVEMAAQGLVGCVSPIYYQDMQDLENIIGFMNMLQSASPTPVLFIT
jgi:hypothetical protein